MNHNKNTRVALRTPQPSQKTSQNYKRIRNFGQIAFDLAEKQESRDNKKAYKTNRKLRLAEKQRQKDDFGINWDTVNALVKQGITLERAKVLADCLVPRVKCEIIIANINYGTSQDIYEIIVPKGIKVPNAELITRCDNGTVDLSQPKGHRCIFGGFVERNTNFPNEYKVYVYKD